MLSRRVKRRRCPSGRTLEVPIRVFPLVLVGIVAGAPPLYSQVTTGTLQGRVTETSTGRPVGGAVVRVQGTTLEKTTNPDGFYFINEVPAGLQDVEAGFIGYRPVLVEGERILAGQTTTIDFVLEQTALELSPITVEGVRNPLVPRDQVATKAIVRGEVVDLLPVDNVAEIVVLQPGAYEVNCDDTNELDGEFNGRCLSIRGGRPNEEALYVDGVLVRSFGTGAAQNLSLPTNALEQVDVTVGGFSAEFGEAQSGVVSYVTRTGGPRWSGSVQASTDRIAPEAWITDFNRLEANLGGPVTGPLSLFVAGTATGQSYFDHEGGPAWWVQDGADICPDAPQFAGLCTPGEPAVFTLPRTSSAEGAVDSVALTAPAFHRWDSRIQPHGWRDNYQVTGNLSWQLPRGSRLTLGYTRNRFQSYDRTFDPGSLYRSDNMDGRVDTRNVLTVGSFLTLAQSATHQVALDARVSYQADRLEEGIVDPDWYLSHQSPSFGFSWSDVEFAVDPDIVRQGLRLFDPGPLELAASRSGAVFQDSTAIVPGGAGLLSDRQTVTGIGVNLRANPFASLYGYPISGPANLGLQIRTEERLQARVALDWQIGRFNRLKVGGEYMDIDLKRSDMWLYRGIPNINLAAPVRAGAFVQDRLDVGDLVIEAGVRLDYVDPNVDYPRVPGFSGTDVPDSLQAGYVRWDGARQQWVPKWDDPCGGVTPCLENWVPASTKTEWSPRLGASFPVTPTSTFRLSFGRFVQTPAFFGGGAMSTGPLAASQAGLWDAERDVELPSTRTFEFGYRQLLGTDFVIDLSAFNKKQDRALTFRTLPYEDPSNPGFIVYRDVLTNLDFTESTGFEVKVDKAFGDQVSLNLAYTYLDARGSGWDPWTYQDLTGNASSNLAFLTGEPVDPPSVLLPLESARRHNLAFTGSLQLARDWMSGTVAGAVFRDFGLFAILSARSGQRYTKLENQGRLILVPPSSGSRMESSFGAVTMPWQFELDLRLTKGFRIGSGFDLQLFVDWRNPLDIARTDYVFAETGTTSHDRAMQDALDGFLSDPDLDGDSEIRGFDIRAESPENAYNTYMLLRAEQRFGNGDGYYTVDEQTATWMPTWEWGTGEYALAPSDQSLRLGVRLAF